MTPMLLLVKHASPLLSVPLPLLLVKYLSTLAKRNYSTSNTNCETFFDDDASSSFSSSSFSVRVKSVSRRDLREVLRVRIRNFQNRSREYFVREG